MTEIYGLRERGSEEIRYIGRTEKPLCERLHKHKLNARHNYPPAISQWINSAERIEIIPLVECERRDGPATERRLVEKYCAAGHRLTNSHLVPRARQDAA